jgi:hypothetical protein
LLSGFSRFTRFDIRGDYAHNEDACALHVVHCENIKIQHSHGEFIINVRITLQVEQWEHTIPALRRNSIVRFHNESSNDDGRWQRREKYCNIGTGQKRCADAI